MYDEKGARGRKVGNSWSVAELSMGWVNLKIGLGRNFPAFGGLDWVVGFSWEVAKSRAF